MISNRMLLQRAGWDDWGGASWFGFSSHVHAIIHWRIVFWYASVMGYTKNGGNWLHRPDGSVICHGWDKLSRLITRDQIDAAIEKAGV